MANQLNDLLSEAGKWKSHTYQAAIAKRRDYYRGHQAPHIRAEIASRFPQQGHKMSAYPVPLFRHLAERQATIYRASPRREVAAGGAPDDGLTAKAAQLYAGAMADNKLQRVEQIAAAARLAFLRVATDVDNGRLVFSPRWPDSVHVIPDPDRPADLQRAAALVAEITSADGVSGLGADRRYEVWVRERDGWSLTIQTGSGAVARPEMSRWGLLPWVAVPFEDRDGGALYEDPPADDLAVCDAIAIMYTDLLYTIENQSFTQVWYAGPEPNQKLVGGPGTVWNAGEAGQFGSLVYQPQIAAVKEAADNLIGRWLALHSLAPGSASADPSYESGVALKVKNQPMLEARLSRMALYREAEERWLWPVVRYLGGAVLGEDLPADAELRWAPGDLAVPLDDQAEFELSEARVAAGVSSWPEEMVRLRLAPDLDTAAQKYEANKRAKADRARAFAQDMKRADKEAPQATPPAPPQDDGQGQG